MIHYFYGTLQVGIGQTLCSFEHVSCYNIIMFHNRGFLINDMRYINLRFSHLLICLSLQRSVSCDSWALLVLFSRMQCNKNVQNTVTFCVVADSAASAKSQTYSFSSSTRISSSASCGCCCSC